MIYHTQKAALAFLLVAFADSTFAQSLVQQPLGSAFEELQWLTGTWDRTNVRPGRSAFEEWKRSTDSSYVGRGVTIAGTDTVFVEGLELRLTEDAIYYIATTPGNAKPVPFLVTEVAKTSFKSENPDHDYPTRIDYDFRDGHLHATISGGDESGVISFRKRK